VKRSLIATIVSVLAVGLILAVVITLSPTVSRSVADVIDVEASLREADFAFADRELAYAGGYGLSPAAAVEKGAAFSFADHELMYAGGYGLSPAAIVERGADFDFLNHELRVGRDAVVRTISDRRR
jgi:hypothetical protein